MPEALPITDQMIRRWMAYTKSEYNKDQTYAEAKAEIEAQKAKGCLLYEDCRSCPLFSGNQGGCPM